MIKRTLYFGNNAYLHFKNKQLIIDFPDDEREAATVPVEDIGVVILDSFRLTITQHVMTKLLQNNVALINCDEKHMPIGLMLNLDGHHTQQEYFRNQIDASLPLKKQLWQQTVKSKILNQAGLLNRCAINKTPSPTENKNRSATQSRTAINKTLSRATIENMIYWAKSVKSGDPDNYEARAAAYYWSQIFSDIIDEFKRGREEPDPNHILNYGYAILRAVTARSLVASGLLPTLGIHHHNKYNAYALADDIMEPYRPYVDQVVREIVVKYYPLVEEGEQLDLMPEIKKELLQIPAMDVFIDGNKSPLMIAMQRTTASLQRCFAGVEKGILYPEIS
jgi:CRISPR-associated protein Cas1